jgi:hypothetical protein
MEVIRLKANSTTEYIEQNRYPIIVITEKPAFSNMAYRDVSGKQHSYDNAIGYGNKKPTNFFFILHLYCSGYLWMNDRYWIGFSPNV